MGRETEPFLCRSGLEEEWEELEEEVTPIAVCLGHQDTASGEGLPWGRIQAVVQSIRGCRDDGMYQQQPQ